MGNLVSPGVQIIEVDLTGAVPNLATTVGGFAGVFRWGPLERRVLIDNEKLLWARFGKPTNLNPETYFTAANFLAYADTLYCVRAANATGSSPIVAATFVSNSVTVTANTSTLAAGMIIVASNGSAVTLGAKVASIVNSTAFNLDSASHALAGAVNQIQLVSNTSVFAAIGNTAQVSNLEYNLIKHEDDYLAKAGTFDSDVLYVARYPGVMGNSLRVSLCDSADAFNEELDLTAVGNGGATVSITVGSNTANVVIVYNHDGSSQNTARAAVNTAADNFAANIQITDFIQFGNNSIGTQALKITSIGTYSSNVNSTVAAAHFDLQFEEDLRLISNQVLDDTLARFWEWYVLDQIPPGQSEYMRSYGNTSANDEIHMVVIDEGGEFSGVPGTVLESYKFLSRATDAKGLDGQSTFYKNVINGKSKYIYVVNDRSIGYSNTALNLSSTTNNDVSSVTLALGQDGSDEGAISLGVLANAYDLFASPEDIDVSILMQGKARGGLNGEGLANYIIDNICEIRKDCVLFCSPDYFDTINAYGNEVDNVIEFRQSLTNSSYAFLDSGYKYQYDRYNDLYRYLPLNGDIAGLAVRTDQLTDPWWAFAGYNRGHIKNVVKLAWSPRHTFRDALYKNDVNPVFTEKGQGTLLLGNKTLLGKESAFSRMNVRRLFITIEKAIGTAAKFFLFELNDAFTRALFRNMVVPYMREIQGRRGVYDFLVVCDETNNTPEVIDSHTMIADIYVKPERAIDFIKLYFVATRTGASFQEIVGSFR
jgi:hypothetical protein